MNTTVRYLAAAAVLLGLSAVQCGSDDGAVTTTGAGGAAGIVLLGGSAGTSAGGGAGGTAGASGYGGVSAGGSAAAGGVSAGGNAGRGGYAGRDGGGGFAGTTFDAGACPGSVPSDGDQCGQRWQTCPYTSEVCTCRSSNNELTWRCIPLTTDGGFVRDVNIPNIDAYFPVGDGGNPAACPDTEPQANSDCAAAGGSALACDYAGTTCVCFRVGGGQSSWFCY